MMKKGRKTFPNKQLQKKWPFSELLAEELVLKNRCQGYSSLKNFLLFQVKDKNKQ